MYSHERAGISGIHAKDYWQDGLQSVRPCKGNRTEQGRNQAGAVWVETQGWEEHLLPNCGSGENIIHGVSG